MQLWYKVQPVQRFVDAMSEQHKQRDEQTKKGELQQCDVSCGNGDGLGRSCVGECEMVVKVM
jgi:hypothetical protein